MNGINEIVAILLLLVAYGFLTTSLKNKKQKGGGKLTDMLSQDKKTMITALLGVVVVILVFVLISNLVGKDSNLRINTGATCHGSIYGCCPDSLMAKDDRSGSNCGGQHGKPEYEHEDRKVPLNHGHLIGRHPIVPNKPYVPGKDDQQPSQQTNPQQYRMPDPPKPQRTVIISNPDV